MRLLVFSDTHGRTSAMEQILSEQERTTDLVIHLGDMVTDAMVVRGRFPRLPMVSIGGNNDFGNVLRETVLELQNVRLMLAHGHQYGVKGSYDRIIGAAKRADCQVLLFGHTHLAYQDYTDGLYVMNPGSTSLPSGGNPSYGVVDLTPQGIVAYHRNIEA